MISRPNQEPVPWTGPTGYVQVLWKGGVVETAWGFPPTPENTQVFMCGSPAMIDDVIAMLGEDGYTE